MTAFNLNAPMPDGPGGKTVMQSIREVGCFVIGIAFALFLCALVGAMWSVHAKLQEFNEKQEKANNDLQILPPPPVNNYYLEVPKKFQVPKEVPYDSVKDAPKTEYIQPLVYRLEAPTDGYCGDMIRIKAEVEDGKAETFVWEITPYPGDNNVEMNGDKVAFTSRVPETYRVKCAAGSGKQIVMKEILVPLYPVEYQRQEPEVEQQSFVPPEEPERETQMAMVQLIPQTPPQVNQMQISYEQGIAMMVNEVPSPNKLAESRILAGVFRQLANLVLKSKNVQIGAPLELVQTRAALALGAAYPAWVVFLDRVMALTTSIGKEDVKTWARYFGDVSVVLASLRQ